MRERVEPTFVQFHAGDTVEGILVAMDKITVQGKPVVRYTVNGGGSFFTFLGTYQINSKIFLPDLFHWIKVHYVGEDTSVTRGENSMKVFEVAVSDELASEMDFRASDSDVGF